MQISPLAPQLITPAGLTSSRAIYQEKIHTSKSQTNINYSDDTFSLSLSISTHSNYIEKMYTAEGVFENSSPQGNLDIMSMPSDDAVSEALSQSTQMLDEAMNKFMEMISRQVENLLREIVEMQQRMLNPADPDSDDILPATGSGSVFKSYSVYSQQTLISTLEITSGAPVSDSGYYSSEKTAERIMNFAMSFYDGVDRQEYAEMVRTAVMKGFDQAMGAFGGILPQESFDTIGIVNSAIDNFAAGNEISMSA